MVGVSEYVTYHKLPNIYLFQSLNRPGVYLAPGGNLGQVFNSIVVHLLQVKLLPTEETIQPSSTLGKLLISAVTHGGVHLFCHWSFCGALSWRDRLLISQSTCLSIAPRSPSSSLQQAAWTCCCPTRTGAEAPFSFFASLSLDWGQQRNV